MKTGQQAMAAALYAQDLATRFPHMVTVEDYMEKVRDGTMPRPERILGSASWVREEGTRTFGFRTREELKAFKKEHGL